MNNYLAKVPFDLYELHLFQLVARHGSFTKASLKAGLTQSAMTRQIQGMEAKLGVTLFERTTRKIALTPAGQMLLHRSSGILEQVGKLAADLEESAGLAPRHLRIGICRTIALAYLPGFFVHYQKKNPEVLIHLEQEATARVLEMLHSGDVDVAIVSGFGNVPRGLALLHEFEDAFTGIIPAGNFDGSDKPTTVQKFFRQQIGKRWLIIRRGSNTGTELDRWVRKRGVSIEPAIETDNFDLIVNLVSLGFGFSIVPHRVLPLYLARRSITKVPLSPRFSRRIWVLARTSNHRSQIVTQFTDSVLF